MTLVLTAQYLINVKYGSYQVLNLILITTSKLEVNTLQYIYNRITNELITLMFLAYNMQLLKTHVSHDNCLDFHVSYGL